MSEGRDRISAVVRNESDVFVKDITNIIECACQLEKALYRSTINPSTDEPAFCLYENYNTELFNLRKALEEMFGSDIPCDGYGEEETDE